MVELLRVFWKDFKIQICVIAAIIGVVYVVGLSEATTNPWTLWRQEWAQDSPANQRRIAAYRTEKDCTDEQWKKLRELSELKEQTKASVADKMPSVLNVSRVFIQEGWTIFEFRKSFLSSLKQKTALPPEMQTEIVAATSFFCAPTSTLYGLWPYHTPSYGAASDTLKRIGERTLAIQAGQLLKD
jgi:hypothetical protein